jgi:hypothetical protein
LRVQALAVTVGAADDVHELLKLGNERLGFRAAIFLEQFGDDAVPRTAVLLRVLPVPPGVGDVLALGAPQPNAALLVIQLGPGPFEHRAFVEAQLAVHRLGDAGVDVALPAAEILPGPDQLDGSL